MNRADYQMVEWLCFILGGIFALFGLFVYYSLRHIISIPEATSVFSSFYPYTSFLVFGGIILVVIGLGFRWRASQEKS